MSTSGMTGTKTISNYDGIGSYIHAYEIFKKKICNISSWRPADTSSQSGAGNAKLPF